MDGGSVIYVYKRPITYSVFATCHFQKQQRPSVRQTLSSEIVVGLYHNAVRLNQRWKVITPSITEFAFILGAMKAGTSTLWSYLIQHPSICKCLFKEPNFWSNPSDPPDLANYYRLWLPRPLRHQIALEASPCYTASAAELSVAERLRHLPGKKHFLYLVRDPVDRVESQIAHSVGKAQLSLEDAYALDDFSGFITPSRYHWQLSRYREAFPDTPITILNFNDLKLEPLSVVRQACVALRIDPEHPFRNVGTKNPRKQQHGAAQFKLDDAKAATIRASLKDDMLRFQDEYGFPVSSWGFS